jgi:2-polyprenyl-6-methoxyphenol hydroxylase-like FAD-dependent oxidoreductase
MQADTPVLIVGGGPVGLATALELAWRGIRSVLVEQDSRTAPVLLAKAGTLNVRTLEFCRRWGIADAVANWGAPDDFPRDTVYCTSLQGRFIGRDVAPSQRERRAPECSPEMLQKCPQHVFDPLLARTVLERGQARILYATRLLSVTQDENGVTALLEDLGTGRQAPLRAQYLVGCDGAASVVRRTLGIAFEGPTLDYSVSALVQIDRLERFHAFGRAERFMFLGREGTWANLTSVDFQMLWRFTLVGAEERLDPARLDLPAWLDRAFGEGVVPHEVLRVVPWHRSQCTAARYVHGRVLLAGDAAHTTSPTGGHGLNTGLGDVVGVGWVLEALLKGWGGPQLLRAYEVERRPVAIRNSESSTRNYRGWVRRDTDYALIDDAGPEGEAARTTIGRRLSEMQYPEWNSLGIALGYRYNQSPVIVGDGTPEPADDPSDYVQTGRPGHRAPHTWLADGRSTLELFGLGFVMLCLGSAPALASALLDAAAAEGVPLQVACAHEPDVARVYERRWVLVRPDGQVAWRGDALPDDPLALLRTVCGKAAATMGEGAPA